MPFSKKLASVTQGCVACGCCAKTCPVKAIMIYKGIRAVVSNDKCVGCGKCARICPAGVIKIVLKETGNSEKALV